MQWIIQENIAIEKTQGAKEVEKALDRMSWNEMKLTSIQKWKI